MASNTVTSSLVVLLLLLLVSVFGTTSADLLDSEVNIADIKSTLFKKGYGAMAVLLPEVLLNASLSRPPTCNLTANGAALTIFAPTDCAFSDPPHPNYTLTSLLQHQVFPFVYIPKPAFKGELKAGDTVDTLLPATPLMFTPAGFNDVPVKDYAIYDVGFVIIHGVDHFFDPDHYGVYVRRKDLNMGSGYYKRCSRTSGTASEALSPGSSPSLSPSPSPMTIITGSRSPEPFE